jgi:hypothetical protein
MGKRGMTTRAMQMEWIETTSHERMHLISELLGIFRPL